MDESLLKRWHHGEEAFHLLLRGEAHHPFDPGAVVPTPIEDDDFACRRQMRDVSLDIHLRFLPLGRRGQRHHAKHPRADAFGDRLDRAALAGAVAPLEDDANLQSLMDHPLLQLDQLDMQLLQARCIKLR